MGSLHPLCLCSFTVFISLVSLHFLICQLQNTSCYEARYKFGLDVEITAAEAGIYIICWIKIQLI